MAVILSKNDPETVFRKRPVKGIRLFVSERSLNAMIEHADSGDGKEVMGLMIGTVYRDDEGLYATVERTITSSLISTEMSVRFDKDSMEDLFDSLDGIGDGMITGWYHSHPDLGCFMSSTDIRTHSGIFGSDCGFAIVIDPVRQEIKAFGGQDPKETMFVIMED